MADNSLAPTSSYLPYYYQLLLLYYYVLLLQLPTDITTLGCATTIGWVILIHRSCYATTVGWLLLIHKQYAYTTYYTCQSQLKLQITKQAWVAECGLAKK